MDGTGSTEWPWACILAPSHGCRDAGMVSRREGEKNGTDKTAGRAQLECSCGSLALVENPAVLLPNPANPDRSCEMWWDEKNGSEYAKAATWAVVCLRRPRSDFGVPRRTGPSVSRPEVADRSALRLAIRMLKPFVFPSSLDLVPFR
ncbi:hypothetical protein TgHK011_009031 [Trichoderma gracile]|nr:hypothetical protein TgHK011_009031 [Trichoderma gracile]